MATRIEPWLSWHEYDAFKRAAPDDPDLLSTYDAWLELANEVVDIFTKSGVPVEKIPIGFDEFNAYCQSCELNPDGVARAAFAVHKARSACQEDENEIQERA